MYGIQWTGCSSGNSLTSKLILVLNVFRIIQTFSSGDLVTVEVFILVDRALSDLGVAGGTAGELLLLPCTPVLSPRRNLPQWGQWTGGECADPEDADPKPPRQPHPRHRYSRSCYWAQGILLSYSQVAFGWSSESQQNFFGTLKLVQTSLSNQIHGTSRQDRAWKGSALLYCDNRQSKSTYFSIVSLLRYSSRVK